MESTEKKHKISLYETARVKYLKTGFGRKNKI